LLHRTKIVAAGVAGIALAGLAAGPALASGDTTTTFTLAGNGLSVSVPATANLSSVSSTLIGTSSLSGSLGSISVTDNRGGLAVVWTATVSSTDFTTGGGSTHETITKTNVGYNPGTISASGIGTAVGTPAVSLVTSAPVVAATGVTGAESASWSPTVSVNVPSGSVAGTYTGTITHSIA
jgi:hypothetical protein